MEQQYSPIISLKELADVELLATQFQPSTPLPKVAVLTSPNQWFVPYAHKLSKILDCSCYFAHESLPADCEVVLILSYHRLIPAKVLALHQHNIVIHASDLPQGKGWSPLMWQVLADQKDIVFSLFEATADVDNGPIYLKQTLHLSGFELNHELRHLQAKMCIEMCLEFISHYHELTLHPQQPQGQSTFYPKRTAKDSELDPNKSLNEQFNLLRTVDNEEYPAFFLKDGHKYILKIYHAPDEEQ